MSKRNSPTSARHVQNCFITIIYKKVNLRKGKNVNKSCFWIYTNVVRSIRRCLCTVNTKFRMAFSLGFRYQRWGCDWAVVLTKSSRNIVIILFFQLGAGYIVIWGIINSCMWSFIQHCIIMESKEWSFLKGN